MSRPITFLCASAMFGLVQTTYAKQDHGRECDVSGDSLCTAASPTRPADHVWANALIATGVISTLGNVGIVVYLFIDERLSSGWALRTMVAFAVGGLLGDVFLHLLPHAMADDPHDVSGGLWVLAGILAFFLVEKIVRMWTGQDHGHSHAKAAKKNKSNAGIRPGAWLNLFADITHNFVDGMAIAAAFRTSDMLGRTTTLGVLMHEIPHEMGDFAVLLAQGFSKRGAFLSQFFSALGAFAGCMFGLLIQRAETEPKAVLNFTAGGFIYVALVDVLPEILTEQTSMLQLLREVLALAVGVGIMIVVAQMESHDHGAATVNAQYGAHSHSHHHGHSHEH